MKSCFVTIALPWKENHRTLHLSTKKIRSQPELNCSSHKPMRESVHVRATGVYGEVEDTCLSQIHQIGNMSTTCVCNVMFVIWLLL